MYLKNAWSIHCFRILNKKFDYINDKKILLNVDKSNFKNLEFLNIQRAIEKSKKSISNRYIEKLIKSSRLDLNIVELEEYLFDEIRLISLALQNSLNIPINCGMIKKVAYFIPFIRINRHRAMLITHFVELTFLNGVSYLYVIESIPNNSEIIDSYKHIHEYTEFMFNGLRWSTFYDNEFYSYLSHTHCDKKENFIFEIKINNEYILKKVIEESYQICEIYSDKVISLVTGIDKELLWNENDIIKVEKIENELFVLTNYDKLTTEDDCYNLAANLLSQSFEIMVFNYINYYYNQKIKKGVKIADKELVNKMSNYLLKFNKNHNGILNEIAIKNIKNIRNLSNKYNFIYALGVFSSGCNFDPLEK